MIIGQIENATRILGEAQGYQPLPIRDEMGADGVPYMVSEWKLTRQEVEALEADGSIFLYVAGSAHPPVLVSAVEVDL